MRTADHSSIARLAVPPLCLYLVGWINVVRAAWADHSRQNCQSEEATTRQAYPDVPTQRAAGTAPSRTSPALSKSASPTVQGAPKD